jgi:hypothetical protein
LDSNSPQTIGDLFAHRVTRAKNQTLAKHDNQNNLSQGQSDQLSTSRSNISGTLSPPQSSMALTRRSSTDSETSGRPKRRKMNIDPSSSASEVNHPSDIDMDSYESVFNIFDDDDDDESLIEEICSLNHFDPIDQFAIPDAPQDRLFDILENKVSNLPKGDLKLVKGQSKKYAVNVTCINFCRSSNGK